MARTIAEIQTEITTNILKRFNLSQSMAAEWRLWSYVAAVSIHSFEVLLDAFRREIETTVTSMRPGSISWYRYMCYRFRLGIVPVYDAETGILSYPQSDTGKIIAIASVRRVGRSLLIQVAKEQDGRLVALSEAERAEFEDYIETICIAGTVFSVVSKNADTVKYDLTVYYDPAYSASAVEEKVRSALDAFRSGFNFAGVLYRQRLIDQILHCDGVVTASMESLASKGATVTSYQSVDVSRSLEAGYFNYDPDSIITLRPINDLQS